MFTVLKRRLFNLVSLRRDDWIDVVFEYGIILFLSILAFLVTVLIARRQI